MRWLTAAWLVVCGCQTTEFPAPVPGSAFRIGEDRPAAKAQLRVDVLSNARECAEAAVDDVSACLPRVDRGTGEVHLSFLLRDPVSSTALSRALRDGDVRITMDGAVQEEMQLIPHEPTASGQLFILLIDGSGSMYEDDQARIRKVHSALLKPSVIDGFFPEHNSKTGVALLKFNDKVRGIDGGVPRIVTTREEYIAAVNTHLMRPSGGYTHLYDAVMYSVTELLSVSEIDQFLKVSGAAPTVIVLTDGFNNERGSDLCSDNAPRLQRVLDRLREVRGSHGGHTRPTVYTVGLGLRYRKGDKPTGLNRAVTARDLCGKLADYRIDGGLEDVGIDHVSLKWIAEAGGGATFVRQKPKGLAEVFERAAATRYRWYEVWYRVVDSLYLRRSFEVQVQVLAWERAFTEVTLMPSPWLDGPGGHSVAGSRWHTSTPSRHSLAVLLPALGLLLFLGFLGPAFFNARRAILRRARPRR